jgi:hypothetical protein
MCFSEATYTIYPEKYMGCTAFPNEQLYPIRRISRSGALVFLLPRLHYEEAKAFSVVLAGKR